MKQHRFPILLFFSENEKKNEEQEKQIKYNVAIYTNRMTGHIETKKR